MPETAWTPEREAAAVEWCVDFAMFTKGVGIAEATVYLREAIRNGERLREELIKAWTHREYRCPCSNKLRDPDGTIMPWMYCTCGLNKALWRGDGT